MQDSKPQTFDHVTYSIALWGASRESRPNPDIRPQKGSVIDPAIHQARSARIENCSRVSRNRWRRCPQRAHRIEAILRDGLFVSVKVKLG